MMRFQFADVDKLYEKDALLKREDVQKLHDWIKKQPHLPNVTELQVMVLLHCCCYRMEEAKRTVDIFFTIKTHCPELFGSLAEDLLRRTLSVAFINILPQKTPEGYVVVLLKLLDTRPENFNTINFIKVLNMISVLYFHQIGFENGAVVVFDMKDYTLSHIPRLNLIALKKALYYLQEAAPVRLKSIHFINIVPFMDKVIALAKPFLNPNLYNMLTFHPNFNETLFKSIPKEIFPEEYGGDAPPIDVLNETCTKNILASSDFFKWFDSQIVDESKRPGKPSNINAAFGVEGTFRKLEID